MKLVIVAAMAATAVAMTAAPALAQYGDHHDWDHHDGDYRDGDHGDWHDRDAGNAGGWDLDRRIDWMQDRINRGRNDRSLSRHEAWRAQDDLNQIRTEEQRLRYQDGGRLYPAHREQLQGRLDDLNQRIHWLRHNDVRAPW